MVLIGVYGDSMNCNEWEESTEGSDAREPEQHLCEEVQKTSPLQLFYAQTVLLL